MEEWKWKSEEQILYPLIHSSDGQRNWGWSGQKSLEFSQSSSPIWVAGTQILGPSSAAYQTHLQEAGLKMEKPGSKSALWHGRGILSSGLYYCSTWHSLHSLLHFFRCRMPKFWILTDTDCPRITIWEGPMQTLNGILKQCHCLPHTYLF